MINILFSLDSPLPFPAEEEIYEETYCLLY